MEPDDLLCSRNAQLQQALARADGTSRRASGGLGEKVVRSGSPSIVTWPQPCSRTFDLLERFRYRNRTVRGLR
jgi:hypothetical protein